MTDVLKCNDKFESLVQGMNSGMTPKGINENQYSKGINVTCRGELIKTRPGYKAIDLIFDSQNEYNTFTYGRFQGCKKYNTSSATYLLCAVNGNVFVIDPISGRTGNVTSRIGRLNQWVRRLYFQQVEGFHVIQDGSNLPIIMQGLNARLANHANSEIPVGTIMAYGHGRLFLKNAWGQFLAGDIYQPNLPGTVLKFTETQYLNGGGAFALPTELGDITGMEFIADFETGVGSGPLVVFAENGIGSFDVFQPRTFWSDQDIGRIQVKGYGSASPFFILPVLEDLLYMSWYGIASYRLMKSEVKSRRRFTRLWQEMQAIMDQETQWMLPLTSAVLFDDRILMTVVGEKCGAMTIDNQETTDYRFRGIASLDLAPETGMSNLKSEIGPAWDGIWTGIKPTQLVTGLFNNERKCFAFTKDENNRNLLYEIDETRKYDCVDKSINCRLYSREYGFQGYIAGKNVDISYLFKKIRECKLSIENFINTVLFKLHIRADQRSEFEEVSHMTVEAPQIYSPAPNTTIIAGQPQSRTMLGFPGLDDTKFEKSTNNAFVSGFKFQFCLEWDGYAEISRCDFLGKTLADPLNNSFTPVAMLTKPIRDDFDYVSACEFLNFFELMERDSTLFVGTNVQAYYEVNVPAGDGFIIVDTPETEKFTWIDCNGNVYDVGKQYPPPVCPIYPVPPVVAPVSPGVASPGGSPYVSPYTPNQPPSTPPPYLPIVPVSPDGTKNPVQNVPLQPGVGGGNPVAFPAKIEFSPSGGLKLFLDADSTLNQSMSVMKVQQGDLGAVADMTYTIKAVAMGSWPAGASIHAQNDDGQQHGPISNIPVPNAITINTQGMTKENSPYMALVTAHGTHASGQSDATPQSIEINIGGGTVFQVSGPPAIRGTPFQFTITAMDTKNAVIESFNQEITVTGSTLEKADVVSITQGSWVKGVMTCTGNITGAIPDSTYTIVATAKNDPKMTGMGSNSVKTVAVPKLGVTGTASFAAVVGDTLVSTADIIVDDNAGQDGSGFNYTATLVDNGFGTVGISISPATGTVAKPGTSTITVSFNPTGLTQGSYTCGLKVVSSYNAEEQTILIQWKIVPVYTGPMKFTNTISGSVTDYHETTVLNTGSASHPGWAWNMGVGLYFSVEKWSVPWGDAPQNPAELWGGQIQDTPFWNQFGPTGQTGFFFVTDYADNGCPQGIVVRHLAHSIYYTLYTETFGPP